MILASSLLTAVTAVLSLFALWRCARKVGVGGQLLAHCRLPRLANLGLLLRLLRSVFASLPQLRLDRLIDFGLFRGLLGAVRSGFTGSTGSTSLSELESSLSTVVTVEELLQTVAIEELQQTEPVGSPGRQSTIIFIEFPKDGVVWFTKMCFMTESWCANHD